ncbi:MULTISPECIES: sensor histidine kinase [Oscillatoriales]|nr:MULTISPECIES: ATP-binding protein [Oscillatoriales]AMW30017.1 histidine kinase [Arthrospira platensis YZ]KDR53953.1 histidine kinase [Arthrospira platensis str. Paraca]MBD2671415.1 HAMP domain-containing histidine kinase [Arthrospira platensis FACHB-439]MBD2712063.1 HAMP domain-containing histidine kinase [Arthrospira platensis FACHB-835]MDC0839827.1 HAMP domain-containing sensor histidine kinase [Limnoraphis robusta]MDF2211920.1 HAMP domain-containing sensor histidine kinase [Arthrospira 
MAKVDLRSRLFLSHLLVMLIGVTSLVIIGKISSPRFFVRSLEQLEGPGFRLQYVRTRLVEGFEIAWNRSTFWSVLAGTTAAVCLSYWVTKRITQPLTEMEEITHKFAKGNLSERMSSSEIHELNQLAMSFNQMASSLQDVEQKRRELISDLTHELRTPITVVRGYLEEMAEGRISPSPDIYQQLTKETKRLERLINNLQELSKVESGYLPINPQPLALRPLLESLVQRFSDQLLEEGPMLELDFSEELPLALADVDRTEQILVNLLGNAIRYTKHGLIKIEVYTHGGYLFVDVSDTGIGISEADLPHVFERFWRADRSRSRNYGGTGIGLAITRRLVELQGGEIFVSSQLGKGSTFTFSLPIPSSQII